MSLKVVSIKVLAVVEVEVDGVDVDVDAKHRVYQNCYLLNLKSKPIKQVKHDFVYLSCKSTLPVPISRVRRFPKDSRYLESALKPILFLSSDDLLYFFFSAPIILPVFPINALFGVYKFLIVITSLKIRLLSLQRRPI